jgi:hypothetical protein
MLHDHPRIAAALASLYEKSKGSMAEPLEMDGAYIVDEPYIFSGRSE